MRPATIALVVRYDGSSPKLIDTLSDESEIHLLEGAIAEGTEDPLDAVYTHREQEVREEADFGDYVEELISQPFVRPEIQGHGVRWLRSKLRIEQYQRAEREAADVIASYAYKFFSSDPSRTDFVLSGPKASVRVRVFVLRRDASRSAA